MAELVRFLRGELDDFALDHFLVVALFLGLDHGLVARDLHGSCEQVAFVDDSGGRFDLFLVVVKFEQAVNQAHNGVFTVVEYGGGVSLETEGAHGQVHVLVFEAVFALTAQGNVFQGCDTVFTLGIDTDIESADFNVLQKQGTDSFGKAEVNAVDARGVSRVDLHVVDGALVRSVKLDADGAGVCLACAQGEVADSVSVFGRGTFARKNERLGKIRIVESVGAVGELDDRSAHALPLQNGPSAGRFLFLGRRPDEGIGNLVNAMRKINNIVAIGMVVQGLLNGFGVVILAVTLGEIGILRDIDNLGTHGEFHLGERRNRKKDNKKKQGFIHTDL